MADVIHVVRLMWRWAWLIGLIAIFAGLGVYALVSTQTPVYRSSTVFAVTLRSETFDSEDQDRVVDAYVQLIRRAPVLQAVIDNLGLNSSISDLNGQIDVTPGVLITVAVEDSDPLRAAAIANELVQTLSDQGRALMGTDRAVSRATIQVIEVAIPSTTPESPRPTRTAILVVIFAGILASGGVWLYDFLDTRIYSANQVHALTGVSSLSSIPYVRARKHKGNNIHPHYPLLMMEDPCASASESYRLLRTRVDYAVREQPIRSIVVTSGNSGEGKSTVAANLAIAIAMTGKQVILVDTNLRNPTLHYFFHKGNRSRGGVTSALREKRWSQLEDYLVPTGVESLRLLVCGPIVSNQAEIISSQAMHELHEALTRHADIVLFDSPPVLAYTDGVILSSITDATLVVAQAGQTEGETIMSTYTRLQGVGVRPLGFVLNKIPSASAGDTFFANMLEEWDGQLLPFDDRKVVGLLDYDPQLGEQRQERQDDKSRETTLKVSAQTEGQGAM